jgi:ribonuclease D
MSLIATTAELGAFCDELARTDVVTVDTEFMRERTFWPRLCLIQAAGPERAAAIDPLAEGIDLAPFHALMADRSVLKVFHAARQDVEILLRLTGRVPEPLFDTQIAAMVCGFGESVGYETLVAELAGATLDKTSRFTDWSRRPLTEKQLHYALADVIHLREVYSALRERLAQNGREPWLAEEMATLTDPATYDNEPDEAWRRLKIRSRDRRFLAVVKELAAWREREAQRRDVPRNRVLRDDALLDIAGQRPRTVADLARARSVPRGTAEGALGVALLEAVARGLETPAADCPAPPDLRRLPEGIGPLVELLKVLLKTNCEEAGVAQRLVANVADLEFIAADDGAPVAALKGWRRELFGADALALKTGRLALAAKGRRVRKVKLDHATAATGAEVAAGAA